MCDAYNVISLHACPPAEPPDSPGPGAYAPQDPAIGPGPAFTMGARPAERDPKADLPAPGDYGPGSPGATGPQGPAFTMRSRPAEREPQEAPG